MRSACLVHDGDEDRYERAAVRWTRRFALEARTVTLDAIQQAVAALAPYRTGRTMQWKPS